MSVDQRSHGGRTRELAALAGIPETELLDLSANLDPAGPPPWLPEAVAAGLARVAVYPDPDSGELKRAAAARYGIPPERLVFADGADSLILALPRACRAASCIVASPSYSGYLRAAERAGLPIRRLPLDARQGFSLRDPAFEAALASALETAPRPALVLLGAPNNPAGGSPRLELILALAREHPEARFALDESFAELAGTGDEALRLAGSSEAENLIVLRSLTKTWAVPGARIGFATASASQAAALRAELSAWPVSCFAEAIALRAFADAERPRASADAVARDAAELVRALAARGGLRIHSSGANFLLIELAASSADIAPAKTLARALLREGIAVRTFEAEEGLDGHFLRVAVRAGPENSRLLEALGRLLHPARSRKPEAP